MKIKRSKILFALGVLLLLVTPVYAQIYKKSAEEQKQMWQSTATMKASGSQYSSQVTPVGSPVVYSVATTTETYNPLSGSRPSGPSYTDEWKPDGDDFGGGAETGGSTQYPLGDGMIPMLLFAAIFCGWITIRTRKERIKG